VLGVGLFAVALATSGSLEWHHLAWKGAYILLHPPRRTAADVRAEGSPVTPADVGMTSEPLDVDLGGGVEVHGWLTRTTVAPHRGLVLFLHGLSDSAARGVGAAERYVPEGFDVAAYDQRGAGDSPGQVTYGALESQDVHHVLDALAARGVDVSRVLLFGCSMGAATAVMAGPDDSRVVAVVAQSPYSSLVDVVRAHVPWWLPSGIGDSAAALAGHDAGFDPGVVVPRTAAARLRVPLLVIAGDADHVVPESESVAVEEAAGGPHQLHVVPGADHNAVLSQDGVATWGAIDQFIQGALQAPP
jgi:pimeloyl-ACP methyl ester carboxylesterase